MPRAEGIARTKVVVRRLPPYLKEEDFFTELKKHAAETYKWCLYCPGKASAKRMRFSRAYVSFHDSKGVLDFKSKFDGLVFVGTRGTQYKCSVEYAPYQKIPKQGHGKKDPREGTIQEDPDFQNFVENFDKAPEMLPSAQKQFEEKVSQKMAAGEGEDGIITTPLMEFIVSKHLAKAKTAREKREAKQKELKNARRSKAKSVPPSVKIKSRPTQRVEHFEKAESRKYSSGRSRRYSKPREGQEPPLPMQIIKKKPNPLEEKKEKQIDGGVGSNSATQSQRDGDGGQGRSGQHGYPRRGNRPEGRNVTHRPNVKVVWIPKADKTKSE